MLTAVLVSVPSAYHSQPREVWQINENQEHRIEGLKSNDFGLGRFQSLLSKWALMFPLLTEWYHVLFVKDHYPSRIFHLLVFEANYHSAYAGSPAGSTSLFISNKATSVGGRPVAEALGRLKTWGNLFLSQRLTDFRGGFAGCSILEYKDGWTRTFDLSTITIHIF